MAQLETDGLESRKHGVRNGLVLANCSTISPTRSCKTPRTRVILGASPEESHHIAERFGLNPAEQQAMRLYLHGPTADGAPMLLSVDTRRGRFTQLVYLTTGVQERWALTTVEQDRALRQRVMTTAPGARRSARAGAALSHRHLCD